MTSFAVNSIRSGGAIPNPHLDRWASGVPEAFDATTTNATLTELTREQQLRAHAGQLEAVVAAMSAFGPRPPLDADPLVRSGGSAARFTATSTWAANTVGLRVAGTLLTLADDAGAEWGLPYAWGARHQFSVWLRGTAGKQVFLKLAMRDSAGANPVYLAADGTWGSDEDGGPVFTLSPIWQKYSVSFEPVFDLDGTNVAGLQSESALVFGLNNLSTADSAGGDPFVFDVDSFEYKILDAVGRHEEA